MSQPPLDQVEWNVGLHRRYAEAMPEPFRAGLCAPDLGGLHHRFAMPPRGHGTPGP